MNRCHTVFGRASEIPPAKQLAGIRPAYVVVIRYQWPPFFLWAVSWVRTWTDSGTRQSEFSPGLFTSYLYLTSLNLSFFELGEIIVPSAWDWRKDTHGNPYKA